MEIESLVRKIKKKKELSGLTDEIVEDFLEEYSKKYNLSFKALSPKEEKIIIKEIRSALRNLTGMFQKSQKDRARLLEEEKIEELLDTHASTRERIDFYPNLKKKISLLKVKSILDLGCGLNPIALATSKVKYFASDIREDELSLIEKYFKKNKIKGRTFTCDLRKIPSNLPKADLCIIFKVLDIIDDKKHTFSKEIIEKVPCSKILVSFATKKLSGKPMNHPRRIWFEEILENLNLSYKTFSSENEVFYLINRGPKTI